MWFRRGRITAEEYERQKVWRKIQRDGDITVKVRYDSTLKFLAQQNCLIELELSSKNLKNLERGKKPIKYWIFPE